MGVYEQILEGLKDGIAQARGELNLKTTTLPPKAPTLSRSQVVAIRTSIGMSQSVFAGYLNVPTKTLQSWEQGARKPKAGEARLLQIIRAVPEQIVQIVDGARAAKSVRVRRPARKQRKSAF